MEGRRALLEPKAFGRFVTALWAVYYSDEDPGISIDPIAPGVDKHLVRYLGQVVNSDLGRVMRVSDYTMKRWSVGTERPAIPGFRNPDDYSGDTRRVYLASSRFWLVPEGLRFGQAGPLLLFDSGRMTVRTEYLHSPGRADPANEAFAQWFTDNYNRIAENYPVFDELFDYAKMVGLAKYLKESGVPLHWFLMANKDLVLTEDSPSMVDALAKGSDYFKNVMIEGGVKLVQDESPGQYVYDAAVDSVMRSLAASGLGRGEVRGKRADGSLPIPERVLAKSFSWSDREYVVVPQHSLTTGRDRRGIRYQTDFALRCDGEPGLELVRYFNPDDRSGGEFGQGWHLLVPYRIEAADAETREFLNAVIPERVRLKHLVTGEEEILEFSTERYSISGYVPSSPEQSDAIGIFLMNDCSYRLADKLGNEFWFDPAGYLTDMLLGKNYRVSYAYEDGFCHEFVTSPYAIEPVEAEEVEFAGLHLPAHFRVTNASTDAEVLSFSEDAALVGYLPRDPSSSNYEILAVLSDGSFRLVDRAGNEAAFDASGRFNGLAFSPKGRMVRSIVAGDRRVGFSYALGSSGEFVISRARCTAPSRDGLPIAEATTLYQVNYEYDRVGRLEAVRGPRSLALGRESGGFGREAQRDRGEG